MYVIVIKDDKKLEIHAEIGTDAEMTGFLESLMRQWHLARFDSTLPDVAGLIAHSKEVPIQ